MNGLDEVLKSTGEMEAKWDGDGWFLVNRGVFTMGDFGGMTGVETWTYDTHSKRYRSTWVDSMGSIGTGEGWFNKEKTILGGYASRATARLEKRAARARPTSSTTTRLSTRGPSTRWAGS